MGIIHKKLAMVCLVAALASFCGTSYAVKHGGKDGSGKRSFGDTVLAEWQGESITASRLEEYAISKAGMAMRHGSDLTLEGLRMLLEELIGRKILDREAQAPEILANPKFTASYRIAASQEVANRYIQEIMKNRFAVSDNEVMPTLPVTKDVVRFKVIVVPTVEEGEEVRVKLKAGMTFDEGIEKYSKVNAGLGSFVDIRDSGDYIDEKGRAVVRSLSVGDLSPVLPMKIGYGVALLIEKRDMTDGEWKAIVEENRGRLFRKKVERHYDLLQKKAGIEIKSSELMLAAGEDFEFMTPHRMVLSAAGNEVYFDDYIRVRDTHLRDAMKIGNASDLYNAYKVEFENLGITLALAQEVSSELGWFEPRDEQAKVIRKNIAMRVLGENLFEGITVTDAEARKEYDGNKQAFTIKKRYKLRRISFSKSEEAKKFRKSVNTAEKFHKELRARETRDDKFQNTYFEWQDPSRMDEKTRKELLKTRAGKLTGVISVSPNLNYIYFVDEIQDNYIAPYEEVRINIKRALLRQKQEKKIREFVGVKSKKYKVKTYKDRLNLVLEDLNRKKSKLDSGHGKDGGGIR